MTSTSAHERSGPAAQSTTTATRAPTTSEGWDAMNERTPTASAGPGFGTVVALVGVLVAALAVARRE